MKFPLKIAALSACLAAAALNAAAAQPAGKAASVNGSIITVQELNQEFDLLVQRMARQGRTLSEADRKAVKDRILDNLINIEILSQESRRQEIAVEDGAVDGQFDAFRRRFGSPERFGKALSEMGLTESALKSKIRENLAIRELIAQKVEPGITVSEEEIRSFYDRHRSAFREPEKVRASHILIKVESDTDKEKARERIDAVRERLESGEAFAEVAAETSEGPSRSKGGDLGFFARGQMVKPFEQAAFSLETGKISPVVETRFGYHVLQVTDRQPEKTLALEDVQEKLTQVLRDEKIKAGTQKYVDELRQSAEIERF